MGVRKRQLLIASNDFLGADAIVKDAKAFLIEVDRYRRSASQTAFRRIFGCTYGFSFWDDIG
jgi:hypothetical protein